MCARVCLCSRTLGSAIYQAGHIQVEFIVSDASCLQCQRAITCTMYAVLLRGIPIPAAGREVYALVPLGLVELNPFGALYLRVEVQCPDFCA